MPDISPHVPEGMTSKERDARVAAENEKRDADRREALAETEYRNALRVHLPAELVDEAARHGAEFVLEEPAPAKTDKPKGE